MALWGIASGVCSVRPGLREQSCVLVGPVVIVMTVFLISACYLRGFIRLWDLIETKVYRILL